MMKQIAYILLLGSLLFSCAHKESNSLVLNEICGKEFPNNEWIELYNPTDSVVFLKGYYLIKVDEDGIDHVIYKFKDDTIAPQSVCVVSTDNNQLHRNISRKKELGIELVNPQNKTLDSFYRDDEVGECAHPANGSYARIPNGTGHWAVVKKASRGAINPEDSETFDPLASDLGVDN